MARSGPFPWEITCYIIMAFMMITVWCDDRRQRSCCLPLSSSPVLRSSILCRSGQGWIRPPYIVRHSRRPVDHGFPVWRARLQFRGPDTDEQEALFSISVAVALIAMIVLDAQATESVCNRLILIPVLTYITIYAGQSRLPLLKILGARR